MDVGWILPYLNFTYKPLASKLHPAGAFSLVKTAFLRILNMYNYIVSGFVQYALTYKFWVSKQHPAGAFSLRKIAFLDFSRMYNSENQSFFQGGCNNHIQIFFGKHKKVLFQMVCSGPLTFCIQMDFRFKG